MINSEILGLRWLKAILIIFITGVNLFAAYSYVPPKPIVYLSDTVICRSGDSITMTVTNPDSTELIVQNVGPVNLSIGSFSNYTATNQFSNFTVLSASARIQTVDMFFAGSVGTSFTILIRNASNGQSVATYNGTVSVSSAITPQVVPINILLAAGNYQIGLSGNPGTYRNTGGAVYPYNTSATGVRITGNTYTLDPSYYYFFYNWKIEIPIYSLSSYTWMPGSLAGISVKVSPTLTTIYTVTSSKQSGASSSATAKIHYLPVNAPVISASGPTSFCRGGSVQLDAGSGYSSYKWFVNNSVVGTSRTLFVTPFSTTEYFVVVGNGGPCTSTASKIVTVLFAAIPTISPADTSFCQGGGSIALNAGTGYSSYSWANGIISLGNTQTISTSVQGNYRVTVTSSNGCSASKSTSVTVKPKPPPIIITPSDITTLCDNGGHSHVTLLADTTGAGSGGTIIWNDLFSETGKLYDVQWDDFTLQVSGNNYSYGATIVNSYGCSNTSNFVNVNVVHCNLPLSLKVFLQGYYAGGGIMNPVLANQFIAGATGAETDTIHVELRDFENPTKVIVSKAVVLMTNGTASCAFICIPGTYWIVIKHRNSLQTWSANPVILPGALYDFSNESSKAFGSNMIDAYSDGIWSLYCGDDNQDEFIDIFDFVHYDIDNTNFAGLDYLSTDFNGDGFVDVFDFPAYDVNNNSFVFSFHP